MCFTFLNVTGPGGGWKRNYDDINEFFWESTCLQFNYFNVDEAMSYHLLSSVAHSTSNTLLGSHHTAQHSVQNTVLAADALVLPMVL